MKDLSSLPDIRNLVAQYGDIPGHQVRTTDFCAGCGLRGHRPTWKGCPRLWASIGANAAISQDHIDVEKLRSEGGPILVVLLAMCIEAEQQAKAEAAASGATASGATASGATASGATVNVTQVAPVRREVTQF